MQNNPEKKSDTLKKFMKEKGYYIVLGLCVVAVGVSGFLFVKTAADRNNAAHAENPTLSVPLTPAGSGTPAEDKPSRPQGSSQTGSQAGGKTTVPSAQEDAAETVAPDTTETAPAPKPALVTVRPLAGETIFDYSVDALTYNETTQDWRTHNGIDIAAAAGDAVLAARDGTVSAVYDDDAMGTTVAVRHENGYVTYYANLAAETTVSAGQSVKAGDQLGTVGDTATVELAQAGHLHFAVLCDGTPVNPEAFLND